MAKTGKNRTGRRGLIGIFRLDALLLTILTAGWLLIFLSASLGLQRNDQQWLPLNLMSQVSADYSVNTTSNTFTLARVAPEIIEAVKQDTLVDEVNLTPTVTLAEPSPPLSVTPTPTPATPGLNPTRYLSSLTVNAGGPYEGDEGSPISLAVGGSNSVLNIVPGTITYRWDLDNDKQYDDAEGLLASVVFYDEGEYPISVRAIDLVGREATDTVMVKVHNAPPIVEIGGDRYVNEAEELEFSAMVSDPGHDVLLYEWNFGDGSPPVYDTLRPEHTYQDDGDYAVYLRVRDNDGAVSTDYLVVNAENLPPLVNAGPNRITNEGTRILFSGIATDPSPFDTLTYAWDFKYDGRTFTPEAFGSQASTIYSDGPANLVAALRVTDKDKGETIETVAVTVNNVSPTIVNVTNNGPVGEGSPLTLEVNATDSGNDPLTYAYDWNNDGTFEAVNQPATPSNIWSNQGTHTLGIRVSDKDGGQTFTTTVVSTFNLTPTAIAQGPGSAHLEGSAVNFDASESYDPGIDDVLTYLWDYGDGNNATGITTTHRYGDNGIYTTTLTVADDSGATDTNTITANILNANPVANAGADLVIDEGVDISVTFNGTATDPGADTLTYDWDFDYDGKNFVAKGSGASVVHLYPALDGPREFMVALRVQDDDYPYPTQTGGQVGEHMDTLKVTVKNLPPQNVDAKGPYISEMGQAIQLTAANAQDVPDDSLVYEWDLDYDGNSFNVDATGQTVRHTWNQPGLYQVGLRVRDEDGGQSLDTTLVNINLPPIAEAGGPYSELEGKPITFDGSSSSDPDNDSLTYIWNFGDGSPAAKGITVTHAYADNGPYTTTLTVKDADGSTATDFAGVTVLNANPIIDLGPNRPADEGIPLDLTATVTDPGSGDSLTYAWDLNYDGNNFDEEASGPSINVTFPNGPTTYTVALLVRDDDYPYPTAGGGEIGEAIDTLQVTVNNLPPAVNAGDTYLGLEKQPLSLAGTATDVSSDTLTYEWDVEYDGSSFTADLNGPATTYTWQSRGVYTVALGVTDSDGGFGLDSARVTIHAAPTAEAGGPYSGDEGSPITLTGSGFDADGDPLTYAWDLDDDGAFETPGQVITHTWPDSGNYTVGLQVSDDRGGVATDQTTVEVNNLPPTADAGPDQTVFEGESITFSATATDPGADPLTYEWDFDYDGVSFNVGATGQNVSTSYPNGPLTYTVAVQVKDGDGGIAIDTGLVTVNNAPPIAEAGGPYTTTVGSSVVLTGQGSDVSADTLTYAWDFDNDGTFETPGQNVSFLGTLTGTYTVRLQVEDNDGGIATDTAIIQVDN